MIDLSSRRIFQIRQQYNLPFSGYKTHLYIFNYCCFFQSELVVGDTNQIVQTAQIVLNQENHVSAVFNTTPNTIFLNKNSQNQICTPLLENSDSTNNSLASSSGIGGSRDCVGISAEEENSLTSFEGVLLNGAPSMEMDSQEDSMDTKDKPLMLADLLERKIDKDPMMNGILGKKDLMENHIKKVLKESPEDSKVKFEMPEDALTEVSQGIKRSLSECSEVDWKKLKFSNGTSSPDFPIEGGSLDSSSNVKTENQDVKDVKSEEEDEKVVVFFNRCQFLCYLSCGYS